MPSHNSYEHLVRLVRVARGLEAGGYYNAAKLLWAAAFSEETRASSAAGLPAAPDDLDREMQIAIDALKSAGAPPELLAALVSGRAGARENRTIPATDIPAVFVCRNCGEIVLGQAPQRCPTCGARGLTFREFLPIYYLEPLDPPVALAALASAPAEVENVIKGLSEAQLASAPRPGEWSIRDALSHLRVAQGLLAGRIEKMLAEDNPSLSGVAAWAVETEASLSARGIFDRYRASRETTVGRLKRMPAQDWWRTAQHEEFGQVTILQQASYFAKHERSHLPQIDAIRRVIDV